MSPQAHNHYYAHEEVHDLLNAAKQTFHDACITIQNPIGTGTQTSQWMSFDMYLIVQVTKDGPWIRAAKLYKQGATLPKVSLSGFETDEKAWSELLATLQRIEEGRKKRLLLPGNATSPSSGSSTATQTNGNSSPSSAASSQTPGPSSTSVQAGVNQGTPSQPGTKPLVAFASTTVLDSIKQPQP
jgi:hypothetical protein